MLVVKIDSNDVIAILEMANVSVDIKEHILVINKQTGQVKTKLGIPYKVSIYSNGHLIECIDSEELTK